MPNTKLLVGWQQRWNRSLMQFLGRRVRATVDIEDLAQETYLRLLRARDLSEVQNPQGYLLRVAAHVVAEWRANQPPAESVEILDEELLAEGSTPEFEAAASVSQRRLDETLESISPTMRAVLLLRLRDNYPCREIAKDLGLTDRQVRRHLTRGYERLRSALEG